MNKEKIRELFLELLEKYEMSEMQVIEEFGVGDGEEESLYKEIEEYKNKLYELLKD